MLDGECADETEILLIGMQNLRPQHVHVLRVAGGTPKWLEVAGGIKSTAGKSVADLLDAEAGR